MNLFEGIHR